MGEETAKLNLTDAEAALERGITGSASTFWPQWLTNNHWQPLTEADPFLMVTA